ncbi:MAG TPA: ribonuclease P protein component [Candidatus Egerieousia sp.]|nr:ribonuclease P protein component [Candidatus Egerieousia sp.]
MPQKSSEKSTFKKEERLCTFKEIEELKIKGKPLFVHPFKTSWMKTEGDMNKILILAPKRNFKKAVDRNLLRRRIREAYRKNKNIIAGESINIFISYVAKDILDFTLIEEKLKEVLKQIANAVSGKK